MWQWYHQLLHIIEELKIIIKGWLNKKENKNRGKKWDHQKIYNIKEFSYNVINKEKVIHKKIKKVK